MTGYHERSASTYAASDCTQGTIDSNMRSTGAGRGTEKGKVKNKFGI